MLLNMRMTPSHAERQRLLDALTDMESALTDNVKRGIEIQRREMRECTFEPNIHKRSIYY